MSIPGLGPIPPPAGGAPPPIPAPGATGPAMAPHPQMGTAANGMALVRTAVEALQKALQGLPMGSPEHTDVMKAVVMLSKHVGQAQEDQGAKVQQLAELARTAQTNPQAGTLARMFPQQGGAPPMAA